VPPAVKRTWPGDNPGTVLSVNLKAWALAKEAAARADELRIAARDLSNGTRLLDFGIDVAGGLEAGRVLTHLCMGGLGQLDFVPVVIDGESWQGVQVRTDHPAVCCMASQYAGWAIDLNGYFAMGSGPVRAKARVERQLFAKLGYADDATRGVLILETRTPPTEAVTAWVAAKAGLAPETLLCAVAPTASIAGGVQIVARVMETGLHKMEALGFDVTRVLSATGTAPLAPTAKNDLRAIGRTNDCVLYGGQARYVVNATNDELAALAARLPSLASFDYGTPFYDIFKRYNHDFYKIDPLLFSPAEVWLTSATSGETFHSGRLNAKVLRESLFG